MIEYPSLIEYYNFILNFNNLDNIKKDIFDIENFDVIYYYLYGTSTCALHSLLQTLNNDVEKESKKPLDKFYLGGHLQLKCNETITIDLINKVENKIKNTDMGSCWGMEIYSVMEHNKRFDSFKKLFNDYQIYINHLKYKPSGEKYKEVYDNFNELLKNKN